MFDEIDVLPQIVGGIGERSGAVCAELFDVFDAPVVQTTPIQAELAKIWTNILRYATFALPRPARACARTSRSARSARTRRACCSPSRASTRACLAAGEDALVVDPWNCFGTAQVFSYAGEAA